MKELILEATVENLDKVLSFLDTELESVDCPLRTQMQLDVAVEEMYVNIANYAYAPDTGNAFIGIEITGDDPKVVSIVLKDSGKPFDPTAKEDPDVTLSAAERKIGGLGIYMAKKGMDKMWYEYSEGQNVLYMIKTL